MREILALVVLLVLLYGCKFNIDFQVDGQTHQIVVNPPSKQ
jgi:hypothetical protein